MNDEASFSELIQQSERVQFDFLKGDIELGHTFAALAKTRFEMGLRESADQSRTNAETAYAAVARLLTRLKDPSRQTEINQRLAGFRMVLDQLAVIALG
jgi:hypothetical protein